MYGGGGGGGKYSSPPNHNQSQGSNAAAAFTVKITIVHKRSHLSSDEESDGVGIDESPEVVVETTTSTSLPKTKRRAAGNKYNSFIVEEQFQAHTKGSK